MHTPRAPAVGIIQLQKSGVYSDAWVPAFAESTPHKRPSHGNKVLGGNDGWWYNGA